MAFGYLSGWSVLLNLIFVPLIGFVFAFLLLCVLFACLLPLWCSQYLLYIPAMLINLTLLLFEVVDFSTGTWRYSLILNHGIYNETPITAEEFW